MCHDRHPAWQAGALDPLGSTESAIVLPDRCSRSIVTSSALVIFMTIEVETVFGPMTKSETAACRSARSDQQLVVGETETWDEIGKARRRHGRRSNQEVAGFKARRSHSESHGKDGPGHSSPRGNA